MSSTQIYSPEKKIAIASSFEGIINNGATECALTSLNARQNMEQEKNYREEIISPNKFSEIRDDSRIRAFLQMRPVVNVAEDYLTVLQVIDNNPEQVEHMLENSDDPASYDPLLEQFEDLKDNYQDERERFREEFYDERSRLKKEDHEAWLSLQETYDNVVDNFRSLVETQERDNSHPLFKTVESGFVPWFATSKDEESTYQLCKFYAKVKELREDDINEDGSITCVISRDRIMGGSGDRIEQLKEIADKEDIPRSQVWWIDDRYDRDQIEQIKEEGFGYQFVMTGGYIFPHDLEKAREDPLVTVIDDDNFAEFLGDLAEEWNF